MALAHNDGVSHTNGAGPVTVAPPVAHDETPLLTPGDVARQLACSRSLVYSLIARGPDRGGLKAIYVGRLPRITAAELARFLAAAEVRRP